MKMTYEEIRGLLDTGDIVLFSGGGFTSNLIKFGTLSEWSHIGLVLKLPEHDLILLWESTTLSKTKDIRTGKLHSGVQLVSLRDRISNYKGDVAIRLLQGANLSQEALKRLMELRIQLRGKPYEQSKLELFKSAWDGFFGRNKENLSSVFCSEQVAEAYQALGLVSEDKPSNEYTPSDFSEDNVTELLGGFSLSKEITIVD